MTDVRRATSSPELLPSWRLERLDDSVRCIGGPDELHVLTELSADTFAAIEAWIDGDPIDFTTPELKQVRDFLRTIGALDVTSVDATPVQWRTVGAPAAADRVAQAFAALPVSAVPELTVVVRTAGSLAQLVQQAACFTDPHLLLDLTGHHTVSLGPFVSPGLTSRLHNVSATCAVRDTIAAGG